MFLMRDAKSEPSQTKRCRVSWATRKHHGGVQAVVLRGKVATRPDGDGTKRWKREGNLPSGNPFVLLASSSRTIRHVSHVIKLSFKFAIEASDDDPRLVNMPNGWALPRHYVAPEGPEEPFQAPQPWSLGQ